MAYKIRPGIVMLRVCDVDLLVAKREAWDKCSRVRPIPRLWAGCWAVLEKGKTEQEVISLFTDTLGLPREKIVPKLEKAFDTLAEEGYLVER